MTTTLAELKALMEKATAAPWKVNALPEDNFENDEAFTVAARNTLPALLAAVEVLAAEVDALRDGRGQDRLDTTAATEANPIAREAVDAARRKP